MREIKVPQINANDATYIINEIYFQNGEFVHEQDIIASIGSSKAINELECEFEGFIHFLKNSSDEIDIGDILAYCFDTKEEYDKYLSDSKKQTNQEQNIGYSLTKPAQKFAKENNISQEQILSLNKKIIKTEDLQTLIENTVNEENTSTKKLSFNQIQSASAVIQSHKEIPQAFHLIKTDCTKCEKFLKEYSEQTGIITGFSEVITVILSELFKDFPQFFSRYVKENKIEYAPYPIIGTTTDTGFGLFMPTVKCKNKMTLEKVSEIMFDFKMKSTDNSFEAEDLAPGNISISYNPKKNIISVVPIVFPNQCAMVSVCSPIKELSFDADKNIIEKSFLYLGLAFDHRVINGSNAMEFLTKISEKIENVDFAINEE